MNFRRWLRHANDQYIRYAPIRDGTKHTLPGRLVVSLTSHARRFATLDLTLRCLMSQSVQPDIIVLWLSPEDWPLLPRRVRRLEGDRLVIRHEAYNDRDIGPFFKIIPTLKAYPDAFIVTGDDDIHYHRDWLHRLASAYRTAGEVLCLRAHRLKFQDGKLLPYQQWELDIHDEGHGALIFPTGVGGVLYPPDVLPPQTINEEEFLRLCPKADDVWLYWMASLAGRSFRRVGRRHVFRPWARSQSVGLFHSNMHQGGNDKQIASMLSAYGLPDTLRSFQ